MVSPRRIDVHFHLIPPFYREAVYAAGRGPAIGRYPEWTPQLALELMDAHGIEVALTSLAQPSFLMMGYLFRPYTANTIMGRLTFLW